MSVTFVTLTTIVTKYTHYKMQFIPAQGGN